MVTLFVFYLHTIGAAYGFTQQWQEEGAGAGALVVAFMAIIFSVGWSISTFILKYLIDEKGLGLYFNRDAISLTILTIAEGVFYYFYLRGTKKGKVTSA